MAHINMYGPSRRMWENTVFEQDYHIEKDHAKWPYLQSALQSPLSFTLSYKCHYMSHKANESLASQKPEFHS